MKWNVGVLDHDRLVFSFGLSDVHEALGVRDEGTGRGTRAVQDHWSAVVDLGEVVAFCFVREVPVDLQGGERGERDRVRTRFKTNGWQETGQTHQEFTGTMGRARLRREDKAAESGELEGRDRRHDEIGELEKIGFGRGM